MPTFDDVAGIEVASTRYRTIAALRDVGPMSRADLARRTGLAPSTITAIIKSLTDEGVVVETGEEPVITRARTGPRGKSVRLNPAMGAVAGVDFGFRAVRLLLTDLGAGELASAQARLPDKYTAEEGLALAAELVDKTLAATTLKRADIISAAVALPGPIDAMNQCVIGSAILPGWPETTAARMSKALALPVAIENDANLAALGEHTFGAGRSVRHSITVKFHSGVGAGIVVDGRLVKGTGGAGEIGHFPVSPRGPLCRCGKRGCLDTYASIPALLGAMSGIHPSLDLRGFLNLIRDGDPGAARVAADAAELVGQAIATACLLLAPQRVIVVGAVSQAAEAILKPIREALEFHLIPETHALPEVVVGELRERATVMGAVAMALAQAGWLADAQ